MARITIYKKSAGATLASIGGYILAVVGIAGIFEGEALIGIFCIACGIGLAIWASSIAEKKAFKLWIKDLEAKGVISQLPHSPQLCLQMYQANPNKQTLDFIAKYNPSAAAAISASLNK